MSATAKKAVPTDMTLRIGAAICSDARSGGFRPAIARASQMLGISSDAARYCASEALLLARTLRASKDD